MTQKDAALTLTGLPKGAERADDHDASLVGELVRLLAEAGTLEAAPIRTLTDSRLAQIVTRVTAIRAALGDTCRRASPPMPIRAVAGDGTTSLIHICQHTAAQNNGPHRWTLSGDPIS